MRSMFHGMGHRRADNRCSGGVLEENDILGCSHCQRLMDRKLWADEGGYCCGCMQPVCLPCRGLIPQHGCQVFVRTLEAALNNEYRRSQNARILGV